MHTFERAWLYNTCVYTIGHARHYPRGAARWHTRSRILPVRPMMMMAEPVLGAGVPLTSKIDGEYTRATGGIFGTPAACDAHHIMHTRVFRAVERVRARLHTAHGVMVIKCVCVLCLSNGSRSTEQMRVSVRTMNVCECVCGTVLVSVYVGVVCGSVCVCV